MSRRLVTAKQRAADARAGPENRPTASAGGVAPIWVLNICMCPRGGSRLRGRHRALAPVGRRWRSCSIASLVVGFAVGEWWRVFIHFRKEAQSFSLSEIPAGDRCLRARRRPWRAGARSRPRRRHRTGPASPAGADRLIFNLASFAIETETLLAPRQSHLRNERDQPGDVWLWVLLFMSIASLLGFAFTVLAISLAEGRQSHRQWFQPIVIVLIGGFANCSLGLVVVALSNEQPADAAAPADTAFRNRSPRTCSTRANIRSTSGSRTCTHRATCSNARAPTARRFQSCSTSYCKVFRV